MNDGLHPLTLGEVLDRTAQLYRSRFLVYFGIGFIPAGTVLVFAAAAFVVLAWLGSNSNSLPSNVQNLLVWAFLGGIGIVAIPVCVGATALGWVAMCAAASHEFLGGEKMTIRAAYQLAWKRKGRYVGLYLAAVLLVAVVPAAVFLGLARGADAVNAAAREAGIGGLASLAMFLVLAALFGYAVWMLLRICLAFPVSLVEQIGVRGAIKRAAVLSKGTKGRIFLLYLLGVALGWILAIGFFLPVGILFAVSSWTNNPEHAQMLGMILLFTWYGLWFAVQAFTKPVYGIALTMFYFDQRIRKEGFDIEWKMRQAGLMSDVLEGVGGVSWLGPATGRDAATESTPETRSQPRAAEPPLPGVPPA